MARNTKSTKSTKSTSPEVNRGEIITASITMSVRHTMIGMAELMEPCERGEMINGVALRHLQEAWSMIKRLTPAFESTLPNFQSYDED